MVTSFAVAWRRWALLGAVVGGAGAAALAGPPAGDAAIGARAAVVAIVAWLGVIVYGQRLQRGDGAIGPRSANAGRLGAANALTAARGLLLAILAGLASAPAALTGPRAFAPALLYGAAVIADRYDGYVARRQGDVTDFGARLDVALDAWGLLVASVVGVRAGQLPVFYLAVGAAYYVFQGFLGLRERLGRLVDRTRLRRRPRARLYAGFQMGFVTLALARVLGPRAACLAAPFVMAPTLALFADELLLVSGWRREPVPAAAKPDGAEASMPGAGGVLGWVATVARVAAALVSLGLVSVGRVGSMPPTPSLSEAHAFAIAVAGVALGLGVLPRIAGVALVLALAREVAQGVGVGCAPHGLAAGTFVLAVVATLLGGGRATVWAPDEARFILPAGERAAKPHEH